MGDSRVPAGSPAGRRPGAARRQTHAHYRRPYRPAPLRLANLAGRGLRRLGLEADLSESGLMEAARRRTGLDDFGEESFREGLAVLLRSIEAEAGLNAVGRWITRTRLIGMLANRLRAQQAFGAHPQILRERIEAPIVITGMQRTGTTLLHRLLAADPDTRALASWEAINPAPAQGARDTRIRTARLSQRALAYMAPDFFAVHPVEAEAPEEDVLLLDYSFLSTVPAATLRVPTYSRWLEGQDVLPAYRYLKRLLQLLQRQRSGRRWVLKSPHHLAHLEALLEVFPRARIVQTHRDPVVALTSFCSMIAHGRGVFSDRVDPVEVGAEWSRNVLRTVKRGMAARRSIAGERFLDVFYPRLLDDPLGQVERIYAFAGIPLSRRAGEAVAGAVRRNVQHRHGRHHYRPQDFGLDPGLLRLAFSEYSDRFEVPEEIPSG